MYNKIKKDIRFNTILIAIFITSIVFIYSTYAWFSSSLDVTISDFKMTTNSIDGLYISLDGVTWSDSIEVSGENMKNLLHQSYKNHTTQWSYALSPISSIGIKDNNNDKFNLFGNKRDLVENLNYTTKDRIDFINLKEEEPNYRNLYVAFDIFIKNRTPSPYNDNIYIDESTNINGKVEENNLILNSVRVGISFTDIVRSDSDINTIQNIKCNNRCTSLIYEPCANDHDEDTIEYLKKHGITVKNGEYFETHSVINEGDNIELWSGVKGSDVKYDSNHFALQNTIKNFDNPIISMPDGIVKARIYIWIEGQDIDIIKHKSEDDTVSVTLNFVKDHASLN